MKKIGLLAALATIVTVGGVYATWNYVTGTTAKVEAYPQVGITGVQENKDPRGTLNLTNNMSYIIDDTDGNYVAELIFQSGTCVFSYTPATGAELPTHFEWTFTTGDTGTFNNQAIFVDNDKSGTITYDAGATQYDLTDTVKGFVALANSISLPTIQDYNTFKSALPTRNFTLVVSAVYASDSANG